MKNEFKQKLFESKQARRALLEDKSVRDRELIEIKKQLEDCQSDLQQMKQNQSSEVAKAIELQKRITLDHTL